MLTPHFARPPFAPALLGGFLWLSTCTGCVTEPDREPTLWPGQTLEQKSKAGWVRAAVHWAEPPNASRKNTFHAELAALAGGTPDVASVTVFMPAHSHWADPPTITRLGTLAIISDVTFAMPGRWRIELVLTIGEISDKLDFAVEVP